MLAFERITFFLAHVGLAFSIAACSSSPGDEGTGGVSGGPDGGSELPGSGGALGTGGAGTDGGGGTSNGATGGTGTGGDVGGVTGGTGGGGDPGAPVPSVGCTQGSSVTTGAKTMTSSGITRAYTIDIPADYDPEKPYRLVFTWHWVGASDNAVVEGQVNPGGGANWAYYGLKRQANEADDPAIFIAPERRTNAVSGEEISGWDQKDHVYFDDLLEMAKTQLCIDESRVFSVGFSFGAMQTYSLSLAHQEDLRAVAMLAPANFNIYLPTNTHEPIAYFSATGMSDTLCYWEGTDPNRGAKVAALQRAEDNGCDIPDAIPTTTVGSKTHLCYDFTGCDEGYPVKVCTFDGGHIAAHADGGNSDNGTTTWKPGVIWDFFTQF